MPKIQDIKTQAQIAELLVSTKFAAVRNEAFDKSEALDPSEEGLYQSWRENVTSHLATLASIMVLPRKKRGDTHDLVWQMQRGIVESTLEGRPIGPFAKYFFGLKIGGEAVRASSGIDTAHLLDNGEPGVVATNNHITNLSNRETDPNIFLSGALQYITERNRNAGQHFVGPENYASSLKFFTDKYVGMQTEYSDEDRATMKDLAKRCIGKFLGIADKIPPNIIEMSNIMASIKRLPSGTFDKQFSEGILRHMTDAINNTDQRGVDLIISTVGKLDVSECGDAASMLVDLALRKGQPIERSAQMNGTLRAIANLPHSSFSERAFHTFLETRNNIETASSLDSLESAVKNLSTIVGEVTKNQADSVTAKQMAENIAMQAVRIYNSAKIASPDSLTGQSEVLDQVQRIINCAHSI